MDAKMLLYFIVFSFLATEINLAGAASGSLTTRDPARTCSTKIESCSLKLDDLPLLGEKGERGEKGDKGDPGLPGIGLPGIDGVKGLAGEPGVKGEKGSEGERGAKGDKGSPGETGAKGDKGSQGEPGIKGDMGLPGMIGVKGVKGSTGKKGDKGDIGPRGELGAKGDKGSQGEKGVQGDMGLKGEPGVPGEMGRDGVNGLVGPAGARGIPGKEGPRGPPGLPGLPGTCGCTVSKPEVEETVYGAEASPDDEEEAAETPDYRNIATPAEVPCKFKEFNKLPSDNYYMGPLGQPFQVYCNQDTKETCLRNHSRTREHEYNSGNGTFWLSEVGVDVMDIYGLNSEQIEWLQKYSRSVRQTLKYNCLDSVPYNKVNLSLSVEMLTWSDYVIGPMPTKKTPFFYSVPPETDGCEEGSKKWSSTIIELRSSNAHRLPIIDMWIGDVRGSKQMMSVENVELCFL